MATIANHILDLMFALAIPIAVLAVIYSAYVLITSAGKPDAFAQAKKNIVYVVIGFVLIVFSVLLVQAFRQLFLR